MEARMLNTVDHMAKKHVELVELICAEAFEAFGLLNGAAEGAISYRVIRLPLVTEWDPANRLKIEFRIYSQRVFKTCIFPRTATEITEKFEMSVRLKVYGILSSMDLPGSPAWEEE